MNWNITKAKNHPLNRDGEEVTIQATEGDVVGLSTDADDNPIIVEADKDNSQPAIGVMMEEVQDPTDLQVSGYRDAYLEQRQLRREMREEDDYTLVGDQATYIFHGVMLTDVDGDASYTPGEPVFLGSGGGITQPAPSSGIVQRLGVAVDADEIILDVEFDYQ